jgi:2-amino-4-hydroxy-6-hydroxymethyldihydropteridine diphosphokinase
VLILTDCVLGVGSNLGERESTLAWALDQLRKVGKVVALSNIYENPAVGGPPQPDYLNAAVRLSAGLTPEGLLEAVQQMEHLAGRERAVRWGPRTLDIDLLWIPGQRLDTPLLELPHPRLCERPFALLPLVEVAPTATDPDTRLSYATILQARGTEELRLHSSVAGPPLHWQRVRSRSGRIFPALSHQT